MAEYCYHCMRQKASCGEYCEMCGAKRKKTFSHHLLPGTILNSRYKIGEVLGEGGFGITYIGLDTMLDMKVAIKEYFPNGYAVRNNTISQELENSITEDRMEFFVKGRDRFLSEARTLAKFSGDRGIVDVRYFFEENNTAYIVMEYLDGCDLKTYLRQNGRMSPEKTVELLLPVMEALGKIHSLGLIHRDISPDNIMMTKSGVKLLDFGAARAVSAEMNRSLSVVLKPGFAPEEQYRSKGVQGPWTDIYALCATMYKCITGITIDDATQRVFSDDVKKPSALGIRISPELEYAIMKGISIRQQDRFQSISELLAAINAKSPRDRQPVKNDSVFNRGGNENTVVLNENSDNPVLMEDFSDNTMALHNTFGNDGYTEDDYDNTVLMEDPFGETMHLNEVQKNAEASDAASDFAENDNSAYTDDYSEYSMYSKSNRKKKKTKRIVFLACALSVLCIVFIAGIAFLVVGLKGQPRTLDLSFTLDGVTYTLPCDPSEFEKNGWNMEHMTNDMIQGYCMFGTNVEKYDKTSRIDLSLHNSGGNAERGKFCPVSRVYWDEEMYNMSTDFSIKDGINGSSTPEDVVRALGKNYTTDGKYWMICGDYYYMYEAEKDGALMEITISFSESDNTVCAIEMYFWAQKEKTTPMELPPAEVLYYEAPTALSDDVRSSVIGIDGELYRMPAPLSEFLRDGWKIRQDEYNSDGVLAALGNQLLVLYKGAKEIEVRVCNDSVHLHKFENCVVKEVSVSEESSIGFTLSGTDGGNVLSKSYPEFTEDYEKKFEINEHEDDEGNRIVKLTGYDIENDCEIWMNFILDNENGVAFVKYEVYEDYGGIYDEEYLYPEDVTYIAEETSGAAETTEAA